MTEEEAATAGRVSAKTIRRLIEANRIRFVNLATGRKRAKYRIPCGALAEVQAPPEDTVPTRRRRRRGGGQTPVW